MASRWHKSTATGAAANLSYRDTRHVFAPMSRDILSVRLAGHWAETTPQLSMQSDARKSEGTMPMNDFTPFIEDAYLCNARCLDRMGMRVAADRYWRALDMKKIIKPLLPTEKPTTGFTENGILVTERIERMISEKPRTIPELADAVILTKSAVSHHIIKLRRVGRITQVGKRGRNPVWGLA